MACNINRGEIVQRALQVAGRGNELRDFAGSLLNDILGSLATKAKYPSLRKIGVPLSLPAGSSTVSLPTDIGAGWANLVFDVNNLPITELAPDEFMDKGYLPPTVAPTTGKPTCYTINWESALLQFNVVADQAYGMMAAYFKLPAPIPLGPDGDLLFPWFPDGKTLVANLVAELYEYLSDEREMTKKQTALAEVAQVRAAIVPMGGGTTRIGLSKARFR